MREILGFWNALPAQRRLVGALAVAAVVLLLVGLARVATAPSMALLFAGLDDRAAGEIVAALEQQQIAYDLRGNAIFVAAETRDRARMSLAAAGLPANGPQGYELLENLSAFSTTGQMFETTRQRAIEGELARTILANPQVSEARVHIAPAEAQAFQRALEVTAAVTVTTRGAALDLGSARAFRHLVAAAVSGLAPENVTVIDARAGVILAPGEATPAPGLGNAGELSEQLRARVTRLLEARVGPGRAVVEVAVELDTESRSVSSRQVDPEGRVLVSSETSAEDESSNGPAGGQVTVASNLPDGDAAGAGGQTSRLAKQSREIANYEIGETRTETSKGPGDIKRVTVAVLLDRLPAAEGATSERDADELAALLALVRAAVGYNAERGDVVTLESLQLAAADPLGTAAQAGSGWVGALLPQLIPLAILAIVALLLGLFVVRPVLLPRPVQQLRTIGSGTGDGEQTDEDADVSEATASEPPRALPPAERPVLEQLREAVARRAEDSSSLLRNWIEADTQPQNSEG